MLALLILMLAGGAHPAPLLYQGGASAPAATVSGVTSWAPSPSGYFESLWPDSLAGANTEGVSLDSLGNIYAIATLNNAVVASSDGGKTWRESLTTDGLMLRSIVAGGYILAGGQGVGSFRAKAGTDDWVQATGLPNPIWVAAYGYNPKTGTAFVGTEDGAGIYRSTDLGASWTASPAGWYRPAGWKFGLNVNAITVDTATGRVYIGTGGEDSVGNEQGSGVWQSADDGMHWSHLGLDGHYITSLAVQGGTLYAATLGSGLFSFTGDSTWYSIPSPNIGYPNLRKDIWVLQPTPFGLLTGFQYGGTGLCLLRKMPTGFKWDCLGFSFSSGDGVWSLALDDAGYIYAGTTSRLWKSMEPIRRIVETLNGPPQIVSYIPGSIDSINVGTPTLFSVSATDAEGGLLTYRWKMNGAVVDSATADSLVYAFRDLGSRQKITCIVTDPLGMTDSVTWDFTVTAVQSPTVQPKEFFLSQNYPNPFNPTTRIEYGIENRGYTTLSVYNVLGEKVATLADGVQAPGSHTAVFDGSRFPSGTYFYVLQSGSRQRIVKKMILVK